MSRADAGWFVRLALCSGSEVIHFPARTFGSDNEQPKLLWLVYLTWTTLILCEEAYGRKAWRPSQPLAVPEGLALQRPGPLTCGGR